MKNKNKKIGYYTTILMTASATIGAGIFFKNSELFGLGHGNLGWVIASWLVAALAILALGLSTIELASSQKGNGGVFEWTRTFVAPKFHKMLVSFNKYVYIPMSLMALPIYVTLSLEDAGMALPGGWAVGLVSFAIFVYFALLNLMSIKVTSGYQWVSMVAKLIPVIVVPMFAFINSPSVTGGSGVSAPAGINGTTPFMVILAGIPAISFAYDGFQTTASVKGEMQEPKKLGKAMTMGLIFITTAYLFITIGFGVGSEDGSIFGIGNIPDKSMQVFNVFIALGITGIVNGFTLSAIRQLAAQSTIKGEAEEINWIAKLIYKNKELGEKERKMSAWIYVFSVVSILFAIAVNVGSYGFKINDYDWMPETSGTLYTLVDFLLNFISLIAMLTVVSAIIGGLFNRRTKKVKVVKQKYFKFTAILSSVIFISTGLWMVIATLIDAIGYNGSDETSSLIKFLVLVFALILSTFPVVLGKIRK